MIKDDYKELNKIRQRFLFDELERDELPKSDHNGNAH